MKGRRDGQDSRLPRLHLQCRRQRFQMTAAAADDALVGSVVIGDVQFGEMREPPTLDHCRLGVGGQHAVPVPPTATIPSQRAWVMRRGRFEVERPAAYKAANSP